MSGHIRRRGEGSWELKYETGTDPHTGKRTTRYASFKGTKREAQAELVRLMETVRRGGHIDPIKLSLTKYFDRWEQGWLALQVGPKTRERYIELLRLHVRPHIGALLLHKLQPVHLAELYGKLLKQGLSPSTIAHVHRVVRKALTVAMEWSLLSRNPAAVAKPPRGQAREIEIITVEQAQKILHCFRGRSLYPIIALALATGMRRGELLALRWNNVDLDAGRIQVERSLEQTKAGLRIKEPKTKHGRRGIRVPPSVVAELRAHWTQQQQHRLKLGLGRAGNDDLVFPRWDGTLRSPNATSTEWRQLLAEFKLPAVSLHALRHTHASQLIAAGMDVITISRRLGHASATITLNVYGHLFGSGDDRAAEIIEAAFGKALTNENIG
jgi:integrase